MILGDTGENNFLGLGLGRRLSFSNFSSTFSLEVGLSFLVVLVLVVNLKSYIYTFILLFTLSNRQCFAVSLSTG